MSDFGEAEGLDPSVKSLVSALRKGYAAIHASQGRIFMYYRKNLTKAVDEFDKALKLEPSEIDYYVDRGNAYWGKGDTDCAIADFNEAEQRLDDVLNQKPTDATALFLRGRVHNYKRDLDAAIADFTEALKYASESAIACLYWRGMTYAAKGDDRNAIADFTEAIRDNAGNEMQRGQTYVARGEAYKRMAMRTHGRLSMHHSAREMRARANADYIDGMRCLKESAEKAAQKLREFNEKHPDVN